MWVAKIGYARCSSEGQDLTIQQDRLRKAGCTIIRSEKASGGSLSGRDELTSKMDRLFFIQIEDVQGRSL